MSTIQEVEGKLSRYKRAEIHEFIIRTLDLVQLNHQKDAPFTLFERHLLDSLIKSDFCLDNRSGREDIITSLECYLLSNEKRLTWDDLLTDAEQQVHAMCLQLSPSLDSLDSDHRMELNNRIEGIALRDKRDRLDIFLNNCVNMLLKFEKNDDLIAAEQNVLSFTNSSSRREAIKKVSEFQSKVKEANQNKCPMIQDEFSWHHFCNQYFNLIHGAVH